MKNRIVAHRGNAAEFPENSIEAIQSAIDLGCKFIEFDVHLSLDAVPHVIHDHTLDRLFGIDRETFSTTSDELTALGVPTLRYVGDVLGSASHVTAFVEVKKESLAFFGRDHVLKNVSATVEPERAVIVSFDFEALTIARQMGYRIGAALGDLNYDTEQWCKLNRPELILCDQTVGYPLWKGSQWVAWGVESEKRAQAMFARGFEYVQTKSVRKLMAAYD
jgi:glycerophosphoryl diester phosphodiesterase